jgi:ATP-dependent DNA helicase RecQ
VRLAAELAGPERSAALSRISRGGALLVLLSPEALHAPDIRQALAKSGIALFVAEEAHCASNASHELRPSYAELGVTLRGLDSPPVMALTRVATATVRRDIREQLGLEAPVTVHSLPVRDNLQIVTKLARGEGRQAALVRLVERLTLPGVVLCATPHDVDSVYSALVGAGIAAHRHHSGMTAADRAAEVANFSLPGQRSVMVAVSAFAPGSGLPGIGEQAEGSLGFGRGPGRRDLRFLVHYQSPASIEQYLREIQGAGADGTPATCVLLHESSHRSLHEVMLAQQRFRATHLAELGRALETPALEGRTVSLEALALGSGQSRRTTDRLTALLADAGVVSRTAGWVRVLCTASELDEACRRLGAQLYALREQDARRLASVSAFAEASECKLSCLNQYLGEGPSRGCGRCNACVSELLAPSQESLAPQASARRGVVHEFSVQPVSAPLSGVVPSGAQPGQSSLTSKLGDFGRAGNRTRE